MKRRIWLTYVVTVPEQVGIGYAPPDSVEIERVNESASRKAWAL